MERGLPHRTKYFRICSAAPPFLRLPDGYTQIFRLYVFGPSGFWTMAPLRCTAKFDPFLSLDCIPTPSTLVQSKESKGSNFAIWQPCPLIRCVCVVACSDEARLEIVPVSGRPSFSVCCSARARPAAICHRADEREAALKAELTQDAPLSLLQERVPHVIALKRFRGSLHLGTNAGWI